MCVCGVMTMMKVCVCVCVADIRSDLSEMEEQVFPLCYLGD